MRIAAIFICTALGITGARAESLSNVDREILLENLEKLRESADAKVDARFRVALAAYREAMTSNEAAMDLYLKCIEKLDFDDQQKKYADFREWKRKEAELLSDAGFRLALRYQLRWLILTLRASSEKAVLNDLAAEAQEIVDSVFLDADKFGANGQALEQPVTSSIFARAYEIGKIDKEDWPLSPVRLDQMYEQLIFPPLRTPNRVESLRAAWIKRIHQEGIKVEKWSGNGKGRKNGQTNGDKAPDYERFAAETIPELQWQMEVDLFRHGDEGGAAKRMFAHIERHLNHRSSREWGDQLKTLLKPKAAPAPTVPPETPPGA